MTRRFFLPEAALPAGRIVHFLPLATHCAPSAGEFQLRPKRWILRGTLFARPSEFSTMPSDMDELLTALRRGDTAALDALFALVYDDLRWLARRQLARFPTGQTLAPTVVVHEIYARFAERSSQDVLDRHHFLALAARAMRDVIVDYVRRRQARKRDGGVLLPLDSGIDNRLQTSRAEPIDLIAMDEALSQLETLDNRQARIVEMRFFAGLELDEIAAALDISERTVKRDWQKARAFLYHALH
jgi:RNA polymerase sigma factor (TIGR02999 family)